MVIEKDIRLGRIYRGRKLNGNWKYLRLIKVEGDRLFFNVCERRGIAIGVKEETILDNFLMWATEVYRS